MTPYRHKGQIHFLCLVHEASLSQNFHPLSYPTDSNFNIYQFVCFFITAVAAREERPGKDPNEIRPSLLGIQARPASFRPETDPVQPTDKPWGQ